MKRLIKPVFLMKLQNLLQNNAWKDTMELFLHTDRQELVRPILFKDLQEILKYSKTRLMKIEELCKDHLNIYLTV